MKYLELNELKIGAYYFVESYNGDFAVLKYEKNIPHQEWGMGLGWGDIRYAFKEVESLEKQVEEFV